MYIRYLFYFLYICKHFPQKMFALSLWGILCRLMRNILYLIHFRMRLQCNKMWKRGRGLNTSRMHCIWCSVMVGMPSSREGLVKKRHSLNGMHHVAYLYTMLYDECRLSSATIVAGGFFCRSLLFGLVTGQVPSSVSTVLTELR